MKKHASDTRQHILDVARTLMTTKGYTAIGLAEIVAAAGVPKGSFYYYFKSKEDFGQALLEEYFSGYLSKVENLLTSQVSPSERLMNYFKYWSETQGDDLPHGKCLVVKLGAEVCDLSESMRNVLDTGTAKIINLIKTCIEEGQATGSIRRDVVSIELAEELYQLWLGASLMVKVRKNIDPFANTLNMTLRLLS